MESGPVPPAPDGLPCKKHLPPPLPPDPPPPPPRPDPLQSPRCLPVRSCVHAVGRAGAGSDMCPPVSARHAGEGMSCLHASWLYQLQHGSHLRLCFACFKTAFLDLRDLLESDIWEDEDWDFDLMDLAEAEPLQGASPGSDWGQGQGQPAQGPSAAWGSGSLASAPEESEEVGLDYHFVPTELEPQDVTPLCLGPEDADWTQGLPWRFGGLPTCLHWPSPPLLWQRFLSLDLHPGEPMVLELGTTRAVDPAEAKAWLGDLQVVSMVGCHDAVYFRKMTPAWAMQASEGCWELLLEPGEVWAVRLQDAAPGQDLHRWKLSVLESCSPGQSEELVPADAALLKMGFTILSYSPWTKREVQEGEPASGSLSSTQERDPSTAETRSSGSRGPGESLGPGGAALFPASQPRAPGLRD